jgi:hypothetical protein
MGRAGSMARPWPAAEPSARPGAIFHLSDEMRRHAAACRKASSTGRCCHLGRSPEPLYCLARATLWLPDLLLKTMFNRLVAPCAFK